MKLTALASIVLATSFTASASAGVLIAVDSNRSLYEIDMSNGAKTLIGTVSANAGTTAGLAYDRINDILYVSSTGNDSVYTLNITTGAATLIGAYGDSSLVMHGLEWSPDDTTLYGVSSSNNGLYRISTASGLATLIGTSGLTSFTNLGYNSDTGVMYATNSATPENFYTMNLLNGSVGFVGALNGPTNPNGMAYNRDNGLMYMVDNSTDTLYTINMSTGAATAIGSTGSGNLLGLVYYDPVPGPGGLALLGLGLFSARRRRA
jgi:MYXO-CTERM domain-containing protein